MSQLVAAHYSLWFNPIRNQPTYDISRIVEQSGVDRTEPQWGPIGAFHYWAEPARGYYRSDDAATMRSHILDLQGAGVDFIILDNTNARSSWPPAYYTDIFAAPAQLFLDTLVAMRAEGVKTPHIVFWAGSWRTDTNPAFAGTDIFTRFYAAKSMTYHQLFVRYNGKPLLLVTDQIPQGLLALFTIRKMWGLYPGAIPNQEWSFLQPHPQAVGRDGLLNEQISVTPAFQDTYMSDANTATPRRGGITFAAQWKRAFEVRPKIVTVTWWNEWAAMRLTPGGTGFTDAFSPEYSRDVEPVKGFHEGAFLAFLKNYVAAYKAGKPVPLGQVQDTVDLGSFEYGAEGWKASTNAASVTSVFSSTGVSVPAAKTKFKLLEVYSRPVNGDAWRLTLRTFERPVDFSEYNKIECSILGWGGAPGATSYASSMTLVSATGQVLTAVTSLPNPASWQTISVDLRSWPHRHNVKAIEIGYRAVGGNMPWAGKFFVDDVRATTDSYSIGDFEHDVEGWAPSSAAVSNVAATTGGVRSDPLPRRGVKMLNIQGAPVNGSVLKAVNRVFDPARNLSSFSTLQYSISGWAGAPGATGYITRVIVTASDGETLRKDVPLTVGLYPNWQDIALDISGWSQRDRVSKLEIGFIASGSNQPWAGKFFVDYVRFTKR